MNKKILIVDDEPDVIAVMKFILEMHHFEVTTAYNGEECFEKAKEILPDLILLDVLMPKMFGNEVSLELARNPRTKDIPIVFLTNVPVEFLAQEYKNGLPHDLEGRLVLPKSCSEDELISVIGEVLYGK